MCEPTIKDVTNLTLSLITQNRELSCCQLRRHWRQRMLSLPGDDNLQCNQLRLSYGIITAHGFQCALERRHNGCDGVSNHQPHHCLLNRLFRRRSKKTSKLSVTGLWAGNSPVTGEFHTQRSSSAENVSLWWRHHGIKVILRVMIFP